MTDELQLLLLAAKELPVGDLPHLLGEIEEIRVTALARLTGPAYAQPQQHDELLDTAEASRRLGISRDFLYRNQRQFSFTRHVGRRLLFSALGIEKYIKRQIRVDSKAAKSEVQPVGAPTRD